MKASTIPDFLFQAAETLAKRLSLSRSEFHAKAGESFAKFIKKQCVTEVLDKVHASESNRLDDGYNLFLTCSLNKEEW